LTDVTCFKSNMQCSIVSPFQKRMCSRHDKNVDSGNWLNPGLIDMPFREVYLFPHTTDTRLIA